MGLVAGGGPETRRWQAEVATPLGVENPPKCEENTKKMSEPMLGEMWAVQILSQDNLWA